MMRTQFISGRRVFIMMQQVSIYAENKKGMLENITEVLLKEDINILGSVKNDSAEYGIVRMVVSDPERTVKSLTKAGYLCKLQNVLGVEVADEVGNLNRLLAVLKNANINVNYIYLSFNRASGKPIMVFSCDDPFEVEDNLKEKGFTVL
jgi:hypothetical protein